MPDRRPWLALPAEWVQTAGGEGRVTVRAGLAEAQAELRVLAERGPTGGTDPDCPQTVQASTGLLARLPLPPEPVYRMMSAWREVEFGPLIGFLLGNVNHRYTRPYMRRFRGRGEAYRQVGGLLAALAANTALLDQGMAYGWYWDPAGQDWRAGAFPLPGVLYRRNFHLRDEQLANLVTSTGGRVFNSVRLGKWQMHQLLQRDPDLAPFLPETVPADDPEAVLALCRKHGTVLLKPDSLSRGRGMKVLRSVGEGFVAQNLRGGTSGDPIDLSPAEAAQWLRGLRRRYLAQQFLQLAQVGGSPFDIRAVMQRDASAAWRCTGIECRVAGTGQLITNLARGGYPLLLKEAVERAFGPGQDMEAWHRQVEELGVRFCRQLDAFDYHFGEWGLDLAAEPSGRLWFLEANVLPGFKGFARLDPAHYLEIKSQALHYASLLAGFPV